MNLIPGNPRRLKLVQCELNLFDCHPFQSCVFVEISLSVEIDNEFIEIHRAGK
ncbi:hypothetical protein C2G38_2072832 [Gigaspora rosea]|uniref:Uncharacterized protein n=1 Tax=Gigaspora rosea TaxID=44941 RepID=A0A397VLR3_9GLOM|nr:hypothetical protein C2G38_2072832 [Gigaspora rosea]